ncbi:MAG: enoyl-CoA hydratase/isomerase family protein [Caulobacteraceae bacterium]|nr:enoyl-CoA hydratase/isomerase family protein [Caulobacteraceae bacterium]
MATSQTPQLGCPGLKFELDGHIAIITIDRPELGNSLGGEMSPAIRQIWAEVRDNHAIRAAVITGSGERHFSTGAEVGRLSTDNADEGNTGMVNRPIDQVVFWSSHQNKVWKPVVAAVNGLVNGAGLHCVVDADVIVASENAAFMDTHVNVGQVGAIENIGLTRRLPLGSALRMTLQGRSYRMPAARAYQLGLVDELVATPAEVLPKALEIAWAMAENSPNAVALSKEALWKSLDAGYTQSLEYGWSLLRLHWGHPDFEEGPKAFGEKRAPNWNPSPNARR